MALRWERRDKPVTVEVERLCSEEDEVMIIKPEGTYHKENDEIIVEERRRTYISGKLRVKKDGSVVVTNPGDPDDASYKFIQYELIRDQPRDEPPPRAILLESQLEDFKHHFIHWSLSGPTVVCQSLEKYNDGEPQIDVNNDSDQKFIWVIPLQNSNQFSLKSYQQSYYLAFGSDGKATLCRDSPSDQQNYTIFRFEQL